jgi:flagellar motor switch protein FliM
VPLSSVPDTGEAARPTAGRGSVAPYDFRRPTKLSREHIRIAQMAYEAFARRLTTLLTSSLRQVCKVAVLDISQQSYEEYVTGLETQTLMVPIAIPPLSGTGVLQFSLETALACVDHMLGGPGGAQTVRSLTEIEISLLRGLIDQMLDVMRYSMESIVGINPSVVSIDYNPQFVQAAGATDAVAVASFELAIGARTDTLTLCLPLTPLLPRLAAHSQRPSRGSGNDPNTDAAAARALRERLGDVPVDVTVRFASTPVSPSAILTLTEGDIIPLNHKVGAPLAVRAGGVNFARGVAGKAGNKLAALIVETPEEH